MKVTYWSDIACPYCYIGERNMKKALEGLGLEKVPDLDMRAYELNPDAPMEPQGDMAKRLSKKYNLTPEESKRKISSIEQAGREAGLDLKCGTARYANTRRAHRLIKLAASKGDPKLTNAVAEDLYKAYFTDNALISDPEILMSIGEKHGLGRDEMRSMLDGEEFLEEVLDDERQAVAMGVAAVPFFLVDEKYAFTGALSVDQMSKILNKILENDIPSHAKTA